MGKLIKNMKLSLILGVMFVSLLANNAYAEDIMQIKDFTGKDIANKIVQEGWGNSADTVIILNSKAVIDGILATPLSGIYNAPVLLSDKDNLKPETKAQLTKLKPKNVIIIGGENIVSNNVKKAIQSLLGNVNIERIGGKDRYDTSLLIAKKIDTQFKVEKIYVGYGNSEADLISIASKSGEEKTPIILAKKEAIPQNLYDWLATKQLSNAYFIGGEAVISNNVISSVNNITSNNVTENRVWGKDRFETNGKLIEKFYSNKELNSALVTNVNDYETALMAIPLGIKLKSPLVIVDKNNVNATQSQVLNQKYTNKIYKLGNYVQDGAFNTIVNGLKYDPLFDNQNTSKDVLFFIPHQDDEMLSFSTVIKQYVDKGFNVNVVLMTDGSWAGLEKVINGTNGVCKIHNVVHNPKKDGAKVNGVSINTFTRANTVQCRNDEYTRALQKLGLRKDNIHISSFVQEDLGVKKDTTIKGMMEYLDKYPNAAVHTFYYSPFSKRTHTDHLGLGVAAKELYDNKKISKLYLHVEPYLADEFIAKNKNVKLYAAYPSTNAEKNSIIEGLKEYMVWQPKDGKYAIGYHSVKKLIDTQIKNSVNYFLEYK
ncbi:cell wall-binding repeat-containing protein [Romboutsia sp.]|uniref:cell wall-binding repeat-containing protein n=1 Tax=Romboutsia sp. TaxID=1965302 RepID=UPI003F2CCA42